MNSFISQAPLSYQAPTVLPSLPSPSPEKIHLHHARSRNKAVLHWSHTVWAAKAEGERPGTPAI